MNKQSWLYKRSADLDFLKSGQLRQSQHRRVLLKDFLDEEQNVAVLPPDHEFPRVVTLESLNLGRWCMPELALLQGLEWLQSLAPRDKVKEESHYLMPLINCVSCEGLKSLGSLLGCGGMLEETHNRFIRQNTFNHRCWIVIVEDSGRPHARWLFLPEDWIFQICYSVSFSATSRRSWTHSWTVTFERSPWTWNSEWTPLNSPSPAPWIEHLRIQAGIPRPRKSAGRSGQRGEILATQSHFPQWPGWIGKSKR